MSDKGGVLGKGADNNQNSLRHMRKAHIERILEMAGGDLDKAAQLLGLPVRKLRVWMRKLGIEER